MTSGLRRLGRRVGIVGGTTAIIIFVVRGSSGLEPLTVFSMARFLGGWLSLTLTWLCWSTGGLFWVLCRLLWMLLFQRRRGDFAVRTASSFFQKTADGVSSTKLTIVFSPRIVVRFAHELRRRIGR